MKIKDIQIDGFGVWSGLTVHSLPDNMAVFYGPNEAGKTTLMQFLRTVFYGFTPQRRKRYLPPVYGGRPGGVLRVQGPGGSYEICRRGELDSDGSPGKLIVTDSEGMQHGHHRLAMLLGQMDESVFTNVFAIGLRELQELSTLDDTAAADELYKLSSGLDRVSLVDVMRQLAAARREIVGRAADQGQLPRLMKRRQELKDELQVLVDSGRRWAELAAHRRSHQAELAELKERIEQWELEARLYELALQVRPVWLEQRDLQEQRQRLGARLDLPDDAADKLQEVQRRIAERQAQLQELRQDRHQLRERAKALPLRPGIFDLAAKIEAANEHQPWIVAMQKTIQRLEQQIEETQLELIEDAQRLGLSEEDQQSLLEDRRMTRLPDLSRQAINQLMEPAGEVRTWSTRLKQARQQVEAEKQEADRLKAELDAAMENRDVKDIHQAIQKETELVSLLRKRMHLDESLEKLRGRLEQLEEEAIDLQCDEALPVERSFMMGILFVAGAFLFLWGLGKLLPFFNPEGATDSQTGLLFVISGMFMLFFGLMWSNVLDRGTVSELDEVEEKIDAIRKEIRKLESERDDLERRLPPYQGSVEARLKEAEAEVKTLENLLPVWHNYRAAVERYQSAKKRVAKAEEALRSAQLKWRQTLVQMGLSESMSPKSIRIMADGYESLLQTRRRLRSLEEELEARRAELNTIAVRIDALAQQAFATSGATAEAAHTPQDSSHANAKLEAAAKDHEGHDEDPANRALRQLAQLNTLLTSQRQFIAQKKRMREEDQQLGRQIAAVEKSLAKLQRRRDALLSEYGCESEEELLALLDKKRQHFDLAQQIEQRTKQIRTMIGGQAPYERIMELLDQHSAEELQRRVDGALRRIAQAEERIGQLNQRLGEINQEMKALASNTRLAEVKLDLACVENQIQACARQWQTLATSTWLLDRVCEVYEAERQPETLREASSFLKQLTEGKYVRIWTPLGKNQLKIDNAAGQSLPLEVLSRGTREAVFIALRLSLAAAYARRGVQIPLVLDDVLVNFDAHRAQAAARVLRDFADLGHQVLMFTCHEHIMQMFFDIGVQVRVLPEQGHPGEAEIYQPRIETSERPYEQPEAPVVAEEESAASWQDEEVAEGQPLTDSVDDTEEGEMSDENAEEEVEIGAAAEPDESDAATEEPAESEPVPAQPRLKLHPPDSEPRPAPRRAAKPRNAPQIDWLWYEQNPKTEDWGWIESAEDVDHLAPPADLWRHATG
ncbi:MAG: hypothetical protein D6753_02930 [Planctomycetota bacterium]|nr:MAG: hypothetical protein D6753_02930 [Planctomycetota bacterium]